jgi:prolipoprotein diacylglyceryltransferase
MIRIQAPPIVHLIFELAAFFAGFRYYIFLRKKNPGAIPELNRYWIIAGAAAGAFLGSRLVSAFEQPLFSNGFSLDVLFQVFSGKTIVGGLLGGLAGVEIVKKIIGEKNSSGDLFVFPIILALLVGRIGCFLTSLNDHTVGIPTHLPWGIDFGDGIARHPLMLYEMIFLAVTWIILARVSKKVKFTNGSLFKIFMCSYLLFRFFIEFLKPDYIYSWNLTAIQTACALGVFYYYAVFFKPNKLIESHA